MQSKVGSDQVLSFKADSATASSAMALVDAGSMNKEKLDRLLNKYAIGSKFIDFSGDVVHTSLENRLSILQCMGKVPATVLELDKALNDELSPPFIEALVLGAEYMPFTVELTLDEALLNKTFHWVLSLEDGSEVQGQFLPKDLPEQRQHESGTAAARLTCRLTLQVLPVGYHRLHIQSDGFTAESDLFVAPAATWQPAVLNDKKRIWGISTQLYTLRSETNWGMGDFADLQQVCFRAAEQKADFILLNPLHYPDLRYPENASPYSPDDRRFLNPLYLYLPWCEDFSAPAVASCVAEEHFQAQLSLARASDKVEYQIVADCKLQALELMFIAFSARESSDPIYMQFQNFCQDEGERLREFSAFQASRSLKTAGIQKDPLFHSYLQWLAQTQFQACQHFAKEQGMAIGLIQDLAVGSIVDGSEVQTNGEVYCQQARIGAPADYFNPEGQNWGLPPLQPDALLESGCKHIKTLLQANMKGCGALRIDHVMSFMRLWWCPDDGSNTTGAYVYYPVEILFAILKIESQRHRCAVIGEDLGVVPPEIRQYLDAAKVFSSSVFYFEKYDGWHFCKPQDYKPHALAMMANHDVPPLLSWWSEDDLAIRLRIGLIPAEKYEDELNWRRGEKGQILQWLQDQGLLPSSWDLSDSMRTLDEQLKVAISRACGRIASSLVSVQLDDLAGANLPINIPGTNTEYANWRRKLPLSIEEIFQNSVAVGMMHAMHEGRGD